MKSCPYCGKEYPDEATACDIDGEPLADNTPQLLSSPAQEVVPPDKNSSYLIFPDYRWSARDGWKFLGVILAFEIILPAVIMALGWAIPGFRKWNVSGVGYCAGATLHYAIGLLAAAYFGRTENLASFWEGFGLVRKPTNYLWFGVSAALIIRLCGHFMLVNGWGKGVYNYDLDSFRNTIGFERYSFLVPLLILAPLFEESIYRGFLYKAFRGSYPFAVSVILIMLWTANTHWRYYSRSWIAALDLTMLTFVQCYLREKSDSLWDCILCHFTFNASTLFLGGVLR